MNTTTKSLVAKGLSLILVTAMVGLSAVSSSSSNQLPGVVSQWYDALRTADRDAFASIMAEGAMVELKSLDIVQSKEEFIESMDSWEEIISGTTIETKLKSSSDSETTVLVCYRFSDNSQLVNETFRISAGQIKLNIQETLAENCEAF